MRFLNKFRHFINIAVLIFFFIAEVRADGSPILQSIIVQGDYTFIYADGLYTIHEKDGRFYWDFDNDVHAIDEDSAGKVWALSTGDGCSYTRCFNGDNWTDYPYPRIVQRSFVRYFYFEDQFHMIAEEAPVIAIILKDIPFYCKKIGNGQWSKALLPSGTVGYVSSKLTQQH